MSFAACKVENQPIPAESVCVTGAPFDCSMIVKDNILSVATLHVYGLKIAARLCTTSMVNCHTCENDNCQEGFIWTNVTYITEYGAIIHACGDKFRVSSLRGIIKSATPDEHLPCIPHSNEGVYPGCGGFSNHSCRGGLCYRRIVDDEYGAPISRQVINFLMLNSGAPSAPVSTWLRVCRDSPKFNCYRSEQVHNIIQQEKSSHLRDVHPDIYLRDTPNDYIQISDSPASKRGEIDIDDILEQVSDMWVYLREW